MKTTINDRGEQNVIVPMDDLQEIYEESARYLEQVEILMEVINKYADKSNWVNEGIVFRSKTEDGKWIMGWQFAKDALEKLKNNEKK